MTIGSLFFDPVARLKFAATADVAGVELGTIGVILAILAVIVALGLGLYSLLVVLFILGSGR